MTDSLHTVWMTGELLAVRWLACDHRAVIGADKLPAIRRANATRLRDFDEAYAKVKECRDFQIAPSWRITGSCLTHGRHLGADRRHIAEEWSLDGQPRRAALTIISLRRVARRCRTQGNPAAEHHHSVLYRQHNQRGGSTTLQSEPR